MKTAASSDTWQGVNGKALSGDIERRQKLALFWKARNVGSRDHGQGAKESPLGVLKKKDSALLPRLTAGCPPKKERQAAQAVENGLAWKGK